MDIAKLFKVFSDDTRLEVVNQLVKGNCCTCNFTDKIDVKQPTLTYHLKHIKDSGLATTEKIGTENRYHINYDAIDQMIEYLKRLKEEGVSCHRC